MERRHITSDSCDILDTYKATLCCGRGSRVNALVKRQYNSLVIRISTATSETQNNQVPTNTIIFREARHSSSASHMHF